MRLAVTAAPAADGLYRARPIEARRLPDIFGYDIVEALRRSDCPLCCVETVDDRRWMDSFWREGKQDSGTRRRFYAAGGFCRHHAWLLHRLVAAEAAGAAIADVYGSLAERDIAWLDELRASLARGRRRQRAPLRRGGRCPACVALEAAAERKIHFFVELLAEAAVRPHYEASDGLCFAHLARAVEDALDTNEDVARLLLDDWRGRLARVHDQLAEFDHKRNYRYAAEPKGDEQRSWTEVIRRYVGERLPDGG
jgi:Family of unknown function (DUF6062)